jgi:hypothetical protein
MVAERDYAQLSDAARLTDELVKAGEILNPLAGFTFYGVSVDLSIPLTQVWVIDTLSGGDAAIIDAVVAAHTPTAYPVQDARDVLLTYNDTVNMIPGNVVYVDDADGTVKLASANSFDTARTFGLSSRLADSTSPGAITPIRPFDALTLTTAQWDAVFGSSGGLIINQPYYLSTTFGLGSASAPTAAGQYVVELGYALSSTTLMIRFRQPILL